MFQFFNPYSQEQQSPFGARPMSVMPAAPPQGGGQDQGSGGGGMQKAMSGMQMADKIGGLAGGGSGMSAATAGAAGGAGSGGIMAALGGVL